MAAVEFLSIESLGSSLNALNEVTKLPFFWGFESNIGQAEQEEAFQVHFTHMFSDISSENKSAN